jgi:hypothetical protein
VLFDGPELRTEEDDKRFAESVYRLITEMGAAAE